MQKLRLTPYQTIPGFNDPGEQPFENFIFYFNNDKIGYFKSPNSGQLERCLFTKYE
jgi:hypothetical protein